MSSLLEAYREPALAGQAAHLRQRLEALAALRHPNLVPVLEVGEQGSGPFAALEWQSKVHRVPNPADPNHLASVELHRSPAAEGDASKVRTAGWARRNQVRAPSGLIGPPSADPAGRRSIASR